MTHEAKNKSFLLLMITFSSFLFDRIVITNVLRIVAIYQGENHVDLQP